jgi:polyisoprenyl-teichoic acid--peptidoglycan teichoic acid transferase
MARHQAVRNFEFRQPPPGARRWLLIAALVCLGLASILGGYVIFAHRSPFAAISQLFVPTPQQVFGKQNLLVLVEGLDYDYTANDQPFSSDSRSDVIWAVNLDFATHQVYELSVPRDMLATFPDGSQQKINQAQADGGPKEAEKVIARFLGIPAFDRYAVLRITAAKDIINAIGGVNVDVENSDCLTSPHNCVNGPIDYDDSWGHLHVHLKPGMQHLNGAQAVGYMRFRHDWCSDPCRIMRQQQVLRALVDKIKSNKIGTLLELPKLIAIVHQNLQTDLNQSEMLSIATYFADITPHDVHTAQVPYTGDVEMADGDDLIPDVTGRARLVQRMLVAPPAPVPTPSAIALAAIVPATLRVDVENGSGIPGAARALADRLRRAGFQIGDVGNANDAATSSIEEHSSVLFAGARVKEALPATWQGVSIVSDVSPAPANGSDVTIIIGHDLGG